MGKQRKSRSFVNSDEEEDKPPPRCDDPDIFDPEASEPESEELGEDEYEVEKILQHDYRTTEKKYYYFVRWKGWAPEHDCWVPEENMGCPDLIKAYKEQKAKQIQTCAESDIERFITNDGDEEIDIKDENLKKKRRKKRKESSPSASTSSTVVKPKRTKNVRSARDEKSGDGNKRRAKVLDELKERRRAKLQREALVKPKVEKEELQSSESSADEDNAIAMETKKEHQQQQQQLAHGHRQLTPEPVQMHGVGEQEEEEDEQQPPEDPSTTCGGGGVATVAVPGAASSPVASAADGQQRQQQTPPPLCADHRAAVERVKSSESVSPLAFDERDLDLDELVTTGGCDEPGTSPPPMDNADEALVEEEEEVEMDDQQQQPMVDMDNGGGDGGSDDVVAAAVEAVVDVQQHVVVQQDADEDDVDDDDTFHFQQQQLEAQQQQQEEEEEERESSMANEEEEGGKKRQHIDVKRGPVEKKGRRGTVPCRGVGKDGTTKGSKYSLPKDVWRDYLCTEWVDMENLELEEMDEPQYEPMMPLNPDKPDEVDCWVKELQDVEDNGLARGWEVESVIGVSAKAVDGTRQCFVKFVGFKLPQQIPLAVVREKAPEAFIQWCTWQNGMDNLDKCGAYWEEQLRQPPSWMCCRSLAAFAAWKASKLKQCNNNANNGSNGSTSANSNIFCDDDDDDNGAAADDHRQGQSQGELPPKWKWAPSEEEDDEEEAEEEEQEEEEEEQEDDIEEAEDSDDGDDV